MSNSNKPKRISRREALYAAAGTALAGAGVATAQQPVQRDALAQSDIEAAARLSGRTFTEAQRTQLARRLTGTRQSLQAIRAFELDARDSPAFHFDPRLPETPVPRGESSVRVSRAALPRFETGSMESLAFLSATELSRLIRARKVSSVQLTTLYLGRLKRIGPRLNCVVTLMEEQALAQAARADSEMANGKCRGPLHGIPWGAKDILATKGVRTTWGAKPYEKQVFDYDAAVVRRLDAAGAVLLGKLTTGELALGDLWFGGRTRTPWNPTQGSSGSSAGPGSATAAGLVGFAIGSETLGSIVSPSVVNGVTGLRPTYGRVSRHGAMALSWTMDKLGPMCRAVEDCALVLHAIHGPGPDEQDGSVADVPFRWEMKSSLKDLRIGFDPTAFDAPNRTPARKAAYAEVLRVLREELKLELIPVKLPAPNPAFDALAGLLIDAESAAVFTRLTECGELDTLAGPTWPLTFRAGALVPAADYLRATQVRTKLQQAMTASMAGIDCFVTVPFHGRTLSYTNVTGYPTLITRCGMVDGAPLSVEFVGGLYREDAILRLGLAYERTTPWHRQWPDTEKLPPLATSASP